MKLILKIILPLVLLASVSSSSLAQENAVHNNDVVFVIDVNDLSPDVVKQLASLRHADIVSSTNDALTLKSTADASSTVRKKLEELVPKGLIKEQKGAVFNSSK